MSSFRGTIKLNLAVRNVVDGKTLGEALKDTYWVFCARPNDFYEFSFLEKWPSYKIACKETAGVSQPGNTQPPLPSPPGFQQAILKCVSVKRPDTLVELSLIWAEYFAECSRDVLNAEDSPVNPYSPNAEDHWSVLMFDRTRLNGLNLFGRKQDFLMRGEIMTVCATLYAQMHKTHSKPMSAKELEDVDSMDPNADRYVTVVNVMHGHVRVVQASCNPSLVLALNVRAYYRMSTKGFDQQAVVEVLKWILCPPSP
ncbi:hypothetical protein KEM55_007893 [Ascosphaera atra]|nr:hypothetical protein KEM55_007893 [Ascosphaera atra]